MMDAGVIAIFAVSSTEGTAPPPVRRTLAQKLEALYEERVVGATRYYEAAKVGQRIDLTARIWRAPGITVRDIARIGETYYRIRKVTPKTDDDGLLVTDLDLEDDDGNIRGWIDEGQDR